MNRTITHDDDWQPLATAMSGYKKDWPATAIETRRTGDLIPYARNARTHSDKQVAQIAASIKEWGWTNPLLVDEDDGIIAGHGRLLAAQKLGIEEVPVIVARGWTKAQKQAYVIADNQLALNAGWDEDLLRVELGELDLNGFDVDLLGFDGDELAALMADKPAAGNGDPDATPDVQEQVVSQLGDIWLLGEHRVMCGDSTDAGSVALLMAGGVPFLMVTDPPYGVEYDPAWRNEAAEKGLIAHAAVRVGTVSNDDRVDWTDAYRLFPGVVAYVWHAGRFAADLVVNLRDADFQIRTQIIWKKPAFAISRGHYHWQHEPCWYAVRQGSAKWCGDRSQSTVWEISNRPDQNDNTNHGTQKPVECMARPIRNHGSVGDDVYDPFLGSGTTLIAAESLGRRCYGMEISPQYVDVIVRRWEQYTGREAVLEDGRTFAQVQQERHG